MTAENGWVKEAKELADKYALSKALTLHSEIERKALYDHLDTHAAKTTLVGYGKIYEFGAKMVPKDFPGALPLYTRPATVELTDDEILDCVEDRADFQYFHPQQFIDFARAVEQKLKGIS